MRVISPAKAIFNIIDWFVPELDFSGIKGGNLLRKIRILIAFCLLTGFICLIVSAISFLLASKTDFTDYLTYVYGIIAFINPFLIKKKGNSSLISKLFLIQGGIIVSILSAFLGGLVAPTTLFMLLIPICATFIVNPRFGIYSTVIEMIVFLFFYIYRHELASIQILSGRMYLIIYWICLSFGAIFIIMISWSYERYQVLFSNHTQDLLDELRQTHEQLVQAKEKAESASKTKSAFLANMSHEIRTPLNGILGMTSLVRETRLNVEQQDMLETIRNSGDSLLTIINDILDFSKVEAGKVELEEQKFDLRNCVEEAMDLFAPKAAAKDIEFLLIMAEDAERDVIGDITRLRQILNNLIGNAVKFTDSGEILVTVDKEEGDNLYYFQVNDTGVGIPEDRLDRLFHSFSQVDASTTRKYGGTGLGLAISKKLCELMGGEMWVNSKVDVGSNFQFTVRLECFLDGEVSHSIREKTDLKPILLLEDHFLSLEVLDKQLRQYGFASYPTRSWQNALDVMESKREFSLAILDTSQEGLDDIEFAHKIAAIEPNLPIIFITKRESKLHGEKCISNPYRLVNKPIRKVKLLRSIQELLPGSLDLDLGKNVEDHEEDTALLLAHQYPLRILMAEDNPVNQKVAMRMMEKLGYQIDVVGNGKEAADVLLSRPYDLVFMDIQMPEMDGITVTKAIRSALTSQSQPIIIALTANAMLGDREKYLAAGMDDYLSKPVRKEALKEVLIKHAKKLSLDNNLSSIRS